MLTFVVVIALFLFTAAVSQHLFYWMALTEASGALSPGAYVELRQRVDAAIGRKLTGVYVVALVAALAVLVASLVHQQLALALGAGLAALGLLADVGIAVRWNVPLNATINAWDAAAPPSDWQATRRRWFSVFCARQVVLIAATLALFIGAVVR